MKLIHLSDLHLGKRVNEFSMMEDQKYILKQILQRIDEEQPDGVILAGDIYDKPVPPAEAVELFDEFLVDLSRRGLQTFIISGNHDSAERLAFGGRLMEGSGIHFAPVFDAKVAPLHLEDELGTVDVFLLPFVKPSMVKAVVGTDASGNNLSYDETVHRLIGREEIDESRRNVLVSHQFYLPVGADPAKVERMDSEIRTVGNIDEVRADILDRFDYAALGHIHKPMQVGSARYRYCGTPLACSVSEAGQQKGIIVVELGEKSDVRTRVLPLTPLRQVRVIRGTLEEVLAQACGDYVSIVLTDRVDLDVLDMQDRLRHAFPMLLEIRREAVCRADYARAHTVDAALDPFALCKAFLGDDVDAAAQDLLRDVINCAQEVE